MQAIRFFPLVGLCLIAGCAQQATQPTDENAAPASNATPSSTPNATSNSASSKPNNLPKTSPTAPKVALKASAVSPATAPKTAVAAPTPAPPVGPPLPKPTPTISAPVALSKAIATTDWPTKIQAFIDAINAEHTPAGLQKIKAQIAASQTGANSKAVTALGLLEQAIDNRLGAKNSGRRQMQAALADVS